MQIGYARVSMARQDESIETQREALIDAGCDPGWCFSDVISGTNWSRPGLGAALESMQAGDTLVVTHLDRLGRNLHEMVVTISDLAERNLNLQVLDPAFDTGRRQDRIVLDIMTSLAEWERDLLAARTREGVANARTQGRLPGPKKKLTPEQVTQAKQRVASGESVSLVAKSMKVARSTLYRALNQGCH